MPVIFGHTPAGTSTKTVVHYAQEIHERNCILNLYIKLFIALVVYYHKSLLYTTSFLKYYNV